MSDLIALAERVEALEGPDREVLEAAYSLIHGRSWATALYEHGSLGPKPDAEKGKAARRFGDLLYAEAWLDAAKSLISKHALWAVGDMEDGPFARVIRPMPDGSYVGGYVEGHGKTAVTSLVAAALRAIAGEAER